MTQDEAWNLHYQEVMTFMETNKRRPSKYRLEEHRLLNWIKHNKQQLAKGKLSNERIIRFNQLLSTAERYRRVNQYAYQVASEPPSGGS